MTAGNLLGKRCPFGAMAAAIIINLQGCAIDIERDGGPPSSSVDVASVPDAVPRAEPRSQYGNPESYVVNGKRYHVLRDGSGYAERGIASWYGEKFHGRRTSSGETYDMYGMTAAHKSLPLPSYVEVINLRNGKRIIVRVNDRGPFHENRIIDLTYTAAAKLDILGAGTGLVEVRALDPATYRTQGSAVTVSREEGRLPVFYIQVGAFFDRINAENLRRRLGVLGNLLVNISETVVSGRTLYRV
ncbi:MAG: septal ring lytic transglycosylase RlpA family protein, partial [Gammaproteobacteria bacterium]